MVETNLPDPVLVTRPGQLCDVIDTLAGSDVLAVDTESNGLYAYRERVCLIQFSTPGVDILIDPLALEDLSPLAPIFIDPKIEKVFHAAEYDLLCLKRDHGFEFANIFDTMVAARILGRSAVGLSAILSTEFGVHLSKKYQRANWGRRPLSAELVSYAQLDTHFLIPLRDRLAAELRELGRWSLAVEDFERVCQVLGPNSNHYARDPWRVTGAYDLNSRQAAVLQELCLYRDKVARSRDVPIFKVISDRTLLSVASACPRNEGALSRVPGMTGRLVRQHSGGLLAAVERGLKAKPLRPPAAPRQNGGYITRLEALRAWRKAVARRLGVDSNVVLPRDTLNAIATMCPASRVELEDLMQDLPWRFSHYGSDILEVLDQIG